MRKTKLLVLILAISTLTTFPSFAGKWKIDHNKWWYQNDDGTYPANQWTEIDGKQYYFDAEGYMIPDADPASINQSATDTTSTATIPEATPTVVNYSADSITTNLTVYDYVYHYSPLDYTYHIFEVTNNSPYTIRLSINETAKDAGGNIVGAHSTSQEDIPSGCTVFIKNVFSDTPSAQFFDTTFQVKEETSYYPVIQNLAVQTTDLKDKIVITATNIGNEPVQFAEATVLFFLNGKIVSIEDKYLTDSDYEIKPWSTISEQINPYEKYDSFKLHVTGRKSKWN